MFNAIIILFFSTLLKHQITVPIAYVETTMYQAELIPEAVPEAVPEILETQKENNVISPKVDNIDLCPTFFREDDTGIMVDEAGNLIDCYKPYQFRFRTQPYKVD